MTASELKRLLKDIQKVRVAVLGDFCLDGYWFLDLSKSEPSVETGLRTHPIRKQRYSLGGAGNVVNNLTALRCKRVYALGVLGNDPWGYELRRLLEAQKADTTGLLIQGSDWATPLYIKPTILDKEQNRFDGGNFNRLMDSTRSKIIKKLKQTLSRVDIVIINQQIKDSLHNGAFRKDLNRLIQKNPKKIFIVDTRDYGGAYQGVYLKLNDHEAARLCDIHRPPQAMVLKEEACRAAETLYQKSTKPVFIGRGDRGGLVRDWTGLHEVPAIQILSKIDPVGAGDSMLAGIALGLAAGYKPLLASQFGNFAATVTIQKLHQTGTATPREVLAVGANLKRKKGSGNLPAETMD
jgi:rfaE bifunctional protein kinase chain/domain